MPKQSKKCPGQEVSSTRHHTESLHIDSHEPKLIQGKCSPIYHKPQCSRSSSRSSLKKSACSACSSVKKIFNFPENSIPISSVRKQSDTRQGKKPDKICQRSCHDLNHCSEENLKTISVESEVCCLDQIPILNIKQAIDQLQRIASYIHKASSEGSKNSIGTDPRYADKSSSTSDVYERRNSARKRADCKHCENETKIIKEKFECHDEKLDSVEDPQESQTPCCPYYKPEEADDFHYGNSAKDQISESEKLRAFFSSTLSDEELINSNINVKKTCKQKKSIVTDNESCCPTANTDINNPNTKRPMNGISLKVGKNDLKNKPKDTKSVKSSKESILKQNVKSKAKPAPSKTSLSKQEVKPTPCDCVKDEPSGNKCSCFFPPAYSQFGCTGNISGNCNCDD